jgi:hypothetical protein
VSGEGGCCGRFTLQRAERPFVNNVCVALRMVLAISAIGYNGRTCVVEQRRSYPRLRGKG